MKTLNLTALSILLFFSLTNFAQHANVWMMADNYGMDFNYNPPKLFGKSTSYHDEKALAVYCDENGKLLYYINSNVIRDAQNNVIPNGNNIKASFNNIKGSIFIPDNHSDSIFLFSTGNDRFLYQTTIYNGQVYTKNKLLFNRKVVESVCVVPNQKNYWLISHTNDSLSNDFLVFTIDENGVSNSPILKDVGMKTVCDTLNRCGDVQSIITSSCGEKIAYSYMNNLEVYDFNLLNGDISNPNFTLINDSVQDFDYFYGVEFSSNTEYLYLTRGGNIKRLYQIDLKTAKDSLKLGDINLMSTFKNTLSRRVTDLETGPDGKIYLKHMYWSEMRPTHLMFSIIHNPNNSYQDCGFEGNGIVIKTNYDTRLSVGMGLPNVLKKYGGNSGKINLNCTNGLPEIRVSGGALSNYNWEVNQDKFTTTVPVVNFTKSKKDISTVKVNFTNYCNEEIYLQQDIHIDCGTKYKVEEIIDCENDRLLVSNANNTSLHWFTWDNESKKHDLLGYGDSVLLEGEVPSNITLWDAKAPYANLGKKATIKSITYAKTTNFKVLQPIILFEAGGFFPENTNIETVKITVRNKSLQNIEEVESYVINNEFKLNKIIYLKPGEYSLLLVANKYPLDGYWQDMNSYKNEYVEFDFGAFRYFKVAPAKDSVETVYFTQTKCEKRKVIGKVYHDENQNGVLDAEEKGLGGYTVLVKPNFRLKTTDSLGFFEFETDRKGTFEFEVKKKLYDSFTMPNNGKQQIVINELYDLVDTLNFGVYPPLPIMDLTVQNSTQVARPGMLTYLNVDVQNIGIAVAQNYTVSIQYNPMLTLVDANGFSTLNDSTLVLTNTPSIAAKQSQKFRLSFKLPETASILGDTLTYTTTIDLPNDLSVDNNTNTVKRVITGAYDPNIKFADQGDGVIPIETSYLNYSVYFQNTGSDTAFTVIIRDDLDITKYNIESIEVLSSSHYQTLDLDSTGALKFNFPNILLPDSLTDSLGSIGYVKFKIQLKSNLKVGDVIENQARIYFDFNEPIFTNIANNVLSDLPTSTQKIQKSIGVKVYPNPANNLVNITSNENIQQIQLFDLNGKLIQQIHSNSTTAQLQVNNLSKGVYVLNLFINNQLIQEKLIIQ